MAKWIYERWTPKWPDTPGTSYNFKGNVIVQRLSYDGTLQDGQSAFSAIEEGGVFYRKSGIGNPLEYYRKTSNTTATFFGTDPPLPIKDTLVDTIEAEEGTYPDDGVHSDQLYYVKVKPAFPNLLVQTTTGQKSIVGAKVQTATGQKDITDIAAWLGSHKPMV